MPVSPEVSHNKILKNLRKQSQRLSTVERDQDSCWGISMNVRNLLDEESSDRRALVDHIMSRGLLPWNIVDDVVRLNQKLSRVSLSSNSNVDAELDLDLENLLAETNVLLKKINSYKEEVGAIRRTEDRARRDNMAETFLNRWWD